VRVLGSGFWVLGTQAFISFSNTTWEREQKIVMTKRPKVPVGWYLVAVIDILGQRQLLREMRGIPQKTDQKQMAEFVSLLKETAGTVIALRNAFNNFFKQWNNQHLDLNRLTSEQKKIFQKFRSNPLRSKTISDSIVFFMSLRDDVNKVPMKGIYAALASAASAFLTMLAAGIVIRGGIDVGVGLELLDGEVYGAALSRAYELEIKKAQYPRILIGDELVRYIKWQQDKPEEDVFSAMNKIVASFCTKLIAIDLDGLPFLDYLGDGFKMVFGKDLCFDIVKEAYDFVLKESAKCQDLQDSKLASRYTLLRNYFDNRMHIWHDI
jgi:hypothetical protein